MHINNIYAARTMFKAQNFSPQAEVLSSNSVIINIHFQKVLGRIIYSTVWAESQYIYALWDINWYDSIPLPWVGKKPKRATEKKLFSNPNAVSLCTNNIWHVTVLYYFIQVCEVSFANITESNPYSEKAFWIYAFNMKQNPNILVSGIAQQNISLQTIFSCYTRLATHVKLLLLKKL